MSKNSSYFDAKPSLMSNLDKWIAKRCVMSHSPEKEGMKIVDL